MRLPLLLALLLPALLLGGTRALAETPAPEIPLAEDLQQLGELAQQRQLPILMMFSQAGCSFCERLADDFLRPMLISGDYEERVLIRIFRIDRYGKMRDFDGIERDVYDITSRYRVSVTPTLVFLDGNGHHLAQRMVGLTTPDFFGGYLDEAIDTAYQRLRHPQTMAQKRAKAPGS